MSEVLILLLDFTGNYKNDLWKFNGTHWTWISGDSLYGVYGTKGVASASYYPGGRVNAVSWMDSNDNAWLFGGLGRNTKVDLSIIVMKLFNLILIWKLTN
jgi:hypothetical protein